MSPRLARAEAIHDPGPVTIAMMEEMGWNAQRVSLQPVVAAEPLIVFPNPVRERLSISLPGDLAAGAAQVALYDFAGRRLLRQRLETKAAGAALELDLSALAPGPYLLTLTGGGRIYRTKVVKH